MREAEKKVCPPVLSALLSPEVVADHLKMLPVAEQRGDGKLDTPAKLSRLLHLLLHPPPAEAATATTSCVSAESETSLLCEGDEREKTSQSGGREGEGGFTRTRGGGGSKQ